MKRILLSFILALGIHGMLLGMDFRWFKTPTVRPKNPVISMSLLAMPLKRPDPRPAIRKPALPEKKMVTNIETQPPNFKSPEKQNIPPQKIITPVVQPKKKEPSRKVVKNPSPSSPEPIETPEPPDTIETSAHHGRSTPEKVIQKSAVSALEKNTVAAPPPVIQEATPLYQQNPKPIYPRIAKKRGYQGTVVLEVLVGRSGRVDDLRVFISSGYSILDKAAIKSVKGWLFEPGNRNNVPVDMWVRVPVRFQLR